MSEKKTVKRRGTIFIDNREKSKKILEMFNDQSIFNVEVQYLELGDINFDGLYIERKSINDLFMSSKSDRFWLNLRDAKENFQHYILWIDASPSDISREIEMSCRRGYKYAYNQLLGVKSAVTLMNIPIVEFAKIEDAAEFFLFLFKKIESGGSTDIPTGIKKSGVSMEKRRAEAVSRIRGIGIQTARTLLAQYGSIEDLIIASKSSDNSKMKMIRSFFCESNGEWSNSKGN